MSAFALAFRAERIKWRRNWAFVVGLLIPFTQTGFLFLLFWFSEDRVNRMGPGFLAWYQINYATWNFFFLPVTAALVPWLMWDLEETSRSWKHLLLQPVPRRLHYLTKLLSHLSLLILSQLLLVVFLIVGGLVLRWEVPVLAMGEVHPEVAARLLGTTLLASFSLVALHTWLSSRVRGVSAALIVALGGSWCTAQFTDSARWLQFSPWGLATQATDLVLKGKGSYWGLLLGSLACTAVLFVLGTFDFSRREEPSN